MHIKLCVIYAALLIQCLLHSPNLLAETRCVTIDEEAYQSMYDIGKSLTAKIAWHDFAEVYSHYFKDFRNEPIKLLEIGILNGGSLVLWEKYFPNAEIHGMDASFDYISYDFERAICHKGDQGSSEDLLRVVHECDGNFDVIIDDGGHYATLQITSFVTLFPHLKSGGLYIVEDLHTSYDPAYQEKGRPDFTMLNYLKNLIDDVNFVGRTIGRANHRLTSGLYTIESIQDQLDIYKKDILSIHFYDGIAVIIKR